MGELFSWQFDEASEEEGSSRGRRASRSTFTSFWLICLCVAAGIIGGWLLLRREANQRNLALTASAQTTIDLMHEAVVEGDGELFLALQEDDRASQLTLDNIALFRAEPVITHVRQAGDILCANATWQAGANSYQRVFFFSERGGSPRLGDNSPSYWGAQQQASYNWGTLVIYDRDALWAAQLGSFVSETIDAYCTAGCRRERLPLELQIRADFLETAAPNRMALPSPRLVGLDQAGNPSDRFWHLLESRLNDYLMPAMLRFAVPDERFPYIDYKAAAEAFTAIYPDIELEIVPVQSSPATSEELADFDGAAFLPTIDMITAGLVRDLTPYVRSDPSSDNEDFYQQIWQATVWRERQWAMPQAAEMPLIFYRRDAFRSLGRTEPLIGWTWAEMEEDTMALADSQLNTGEHLVWGFLDQTHASFYSYAFSRQTACGAPTNCPCPNALGLEEVAAALTWYARLAQAGTSPDVSRVQAQERSRLLINSYFKTAMWVDQPVFYESRTTLFPMDVLPMPGSEQVESSTPLWVRGGYISALSERPLAAWQWLKFLSYWPPRPAYRLIPARPSVAADTGFWTGLPRPLAEPMRMAFPLARPVRLQEQTLFDWSTIGAVASGAQTPDDAARTALAIHWFGE
ncbi:MAG: extracellular solute-binding protein [Candidatus Promineifilaceae bacterium]